MPKMNIPFQYMINDVEYKNNDLFVEDDTEEFHFPFDLEDKIDEFIKNDMIVGDLIMKYIWNDIVDKDLDLLNIFKCMYKNTEDLEGKFCQTEGKNGWTFGLAFQFELVNIITNNVDTFRFENDYINTSSAMAYLWSEFKDYLDEYNDFNSSGSDSE